MTTTATTKRAARSGNPATRAAAARKTKAEVEAEAADRAAQAKAQEEAQAKARQAFEDMVLPPLELDKDGYEVIPDRTKLEGGTYRFKVRGQAYELPNLQYLPVALAQRITNAQTSAEADAIIFERYAPGLLEDASADQFMHVIKRWREFSAGVGLGE